MGGKIHSFLLKRFRSMIKECKRALFIFRRDLRLEDNTGLLFALKEAKEVMAAFIFTPEQIEKNAYRSDSSLQFMIESLEELREDLKAKGGKLYLFWGSPEEIVKQCIAKCHVDLVVFNRDYTPYSLKRDRLIEAICKKEKVPCSSFDDALLHAPFEVLKADGKPYLIFTPYYRAACSLDVALPKANRSANYFTGEVSFAEKESFLEKILPERLQQPRGGRKAALELLKKDVSHYVALRDIPALDATTHLSAHLKFTTSSPREVYAAWRKVPGLVRSLHWRDFFTSIAYFFPRVFGESFRSEFDEISWADDRTRFRLWCEGKTGFPIVDAGMRELNATGFMHNRVRMIAASFLVKDLHIDWRWGEKYFAQHLIDYDPAVNNGNWQWVASTGCDSQPYFRIFNPWTQQKKFDPDCEYICRWIPELSALPPEIIHAWHLQKRGEKGLYPTPIIDHSIEAKKALKAYRRI